MKQYGKRIIAFLMAVTMMGFLFFGCEKIPRDATYTFRVSDDETGEREWMVKLGDSRVVSYQKQPAGDGQTDVVFTGLKKGKTDVTLYLARQDEIIRQADNVYVLTLCVDMRRNVTQSEPPYGAYTVRCSGDVSGSEWNIECSDERIVHWTADREYPKKSSNENGMQDFKQLYTFTGRHPGATHVRIYTSYPWSEGAHSTREDFWLLVDDAYRVSRLTPTDFVSFRVSEQGMRAENNVYEAERTEDGVRLSHYDQISTWSDEENKYVEQRLDETVIDGGEEMYMYIAGLLNACEVPDWDGFQGTNPYVLDGKMFSFEAELADGSTVHASGSNKYPSNYREFHNGLTALTQEYAQKDDA